MTTLRRRLILVALTLLSSALACRALTNLASPDAPTAHPSLVPQSPTLIPTTAVDVDIDEPAPSCAVTTTIIDESLNYESNSDIELDEETYLVTYYIDGDEIYDPYYEDVSSDLEDIQNDTATHQAVWDLFANIIPADRREFISNYSVVTDGGDNTLAAVGQSEDDPEQWILEVDPLDAENEYALTFTLIHEYAHLLTLNSEQVPPSLPVFDNPDDDDIYQEEVAACPTYFPGEGCSNSDSYINEFFDAFWFDLYAEWQEIDDLQYTDEDAYYDELDAFYNNYQDQFVGDYAATNPSEDMAETFAFFILSPKPEPTTIANEKILFFYNYPELVQLRAEILAGLCSTLP